MKIEINLLDANSMFSPFKGNLVISEASFEFKDKMIILLCIKNIKRYKPAWECGCDCFSKCFSCWNVSK